MIKVIDAPDGRFGYQVAAHKTGTRARRATTQVALRDRIPPPSPAGRVDGFQLTTRHGQSPGASTALNPVRGRRARRGKCPQLLVYGQRNSGNQQ